MEFTLTGKELDQLLKDLRDIATKTKWDERYRESIMHSNPALYRTMPREDLDNEPITYPVVLLDRFAGSGREHAVEGDTFLSFMLDENGELDQKSIEVWMTDHQSFAREVTDKIKKWNFDPVVIDGIAIPALVFYRIPFRFEVVNK